MAIGIDQAGARQSARGLAHLDLLLLQDLVVHRHAAGIGAIA
jgi:hypothetical protein